MTMTRWATRAWLLGVCGLVTAPAANAQTTGAQTTGEDNVARGEVLFERAYEAYTNGNFQQAAPLFEQAAAYFPHCPTSTLLRGKSLEQLGRLGEAYEAYTSVKPTPPAPDEAPPCAEARREAQARLRALDKQVGWVRLEAPSSAPPQLWLTLPNAPGPAANRERYRRQLAAPTTTLAGPSPTRVWEQLPMTAGSLVIAVDADGATSQTITVTPRATTPVVFAAPAAAPLRATSETASTSAGATPGVGSPYGEPWMWVGGAGIAGVALGTITGLVASSKTSDVQTQCDSAAQLCTPAGLDARDSAETFGWVSNISLGVGLAGIIAAGVLYLNSDAPASDPTRVGDIDVLPRVATDTRAEGATLSLAW